MAEVAEELLPIDTTLRFALFGLECALGISFNGVECERIFREAAENQVSAKQYVLLESRRLIVSGRVDEYESESIWIRVQGEPSIAAVMRQVVERSKSHAVRLCSNSRDSAMKTAPQTRIELAAAILQLSLLRPGWRFGQIISAVANTAGRTGNLSDLEDLHDAEVLAAARTRIEEAETEPDTT